MAVGFGPASGGAVVDGTVFSAGWEGKSSPCVTCQQAVTTPVSLSTRQLPSDPHTSPLPRLTSTLSQKMAKKRRDRRETDGLSSAQEEVKANASDPPQVQKGNVFYPEWLTAHLNAKQRNANTCWPTQVDEAIYRYVSVISAVKPDPKTAQKLMLAAGCLL